MIRSNSVALPMGKLETVAPRPMTVFDTRGNCGLTTSPTANSVAFMGPSSSPSLSVRESFNRALDTAPELLPAT